MTQTSAKILCDSISPAGHRLVTFECVYPRIVLAEVNTPRMLSRVSASSRAVPIQKMLKRVTEDPYVPVHWGKNQKGMQAEEDLDEAGQRAAAEEWLRARDMAVSAVKAMLEIGVHKQLANRLIEAFMWHPTVITATEWSNFFHLRDHKAAHPDFRDAAHAMRELYEKSEPAQLDYDEWHQPYIGPEDYDKAFAEDVPATDSQELTLYMNKVSVGRCARVSTLTHEGEYDLKADVGLHDKMFAAGHMSPYENVARPMTQHELQLFKRKKLQWDPELKDWIWVGSDREHGYRGEHTHFLGNVQGWVQLRKQIPYEEDILGDRA